MKLKVAAAFFALVLIAGVAHLSLSTPKTASAAPGDVTVTFTYWTTNAGGATSGTTKDGVGAGTVSGQYLAYSPGPPATSTIQLQLTGSAHTMTIQINTVDAAVTGSVTDGWLKGQPLAGTYTAADPCAQGNDGKCYTIAFVVNDPAAATTAPPAGGTTTTAPPAVGTGLAPQGPSPRVSLIGLALAVVGAAGFCATTVRRNRRTGA